MLFVMPDIHIRNFYFLGILNIPKTLIVKRGLLEM